MVNFYLATKTLHLLAVISWMAGMLYLPRLFVYHSLPSLTPSQDEIFQTMERRLYYFIAYPAMILTLATGTILVLLPNSPFYSGDNWIYLKIVCVMILFGYHLWLNRFRLGFLTKTIGYSTRFFRILNEVPTVILIAILILVVFKPRF
ncbi:MAG: CopD family protein [Alphaproteobacteria bacterium]|nr:CopD family protein [Alphaproteobacteria bacterium]